MCIKHNILAYGKIAPSYKDPATWLPSIFLGCGNQVPVVPFCYVRALNIYLKYNHYISRNIIKGLSKLYLVSQVFNAYDYHLSVDIINQNSILK